MKYEIQRMISEALAQQPQNRWGIVKSVDPVRVAVRVLIQPEGVLTGWLPLLLPGASSGWSMLSMPSVGDMAMVTADAGDALGAVIGFAHNDTRPAPTAPNGLTGGNAVNVPGEFLLVGKGGNVVRLCADGTLLIVGDINVRGSITTTGSIHALGNVLANGSVTDLNGTGGGGTLQALRAAYDIHKHTGIQRGGGITDTTDTPA